MTKPIRKTITLAAAFIILGFILFVINQTNQVVQLASSVHEVFGKAVLYGLILFYAVAILIPAYLFLRLPKPLIPPDRESSPEFAVFLTNLGRRLVSNRHLKETVSDFSRRADIEKAIRILDRKADETIKKAAATVFVSTAVSQSGRLDAFAVLAAQLGLVWQVAHLYNQRPAVRDMLHLYANVGVATFLAMELEDLDISEQLEPIITNVVGTSLAGLVPGVKVAAAIVTNSLLDGTANAYLTLRTGIITKKYCGALVKLETKSIRRLASIEAARLLGGIVVASSKKVISAICEAAKRKTSRIGLRGGAA